MNSPRFRRSPKSRAHSVWFECTSFASQHRLFYRFVVLWNLARWRDRASLVGRGTDLVIDGVQRSANGFAVSTFVNAQHRHVNVAHHLHSGEQVVQAAKHHTPVLLLIREPASCALSIVGAWPYITVGQALRAYTRYYSRVATVAGDCVIGFFDEVTSDVGIVIGRVNDRYGTSFDVVHPTEESARKVYDSGDPSAVMRKSRARAAACQLDEPANRAQLQMALVLWESFQRFRPLH